MSQLLDIQGKTSRRDGHPAIELDSATAKERRDPASAAPTPDSPDTPSSPLTPNRPRGVAFSSEPRLAVMYSPEPRIAAFSSEPRLAVMDSPEPRIAAFSSEPRLAVMHSPEPRIAAMHSPSNRPRDDAFAAEPRLVVMQAPPNRNPTERHAGARLRDPNLIPNLRTLLGTPSKIYEPTSFVFELSNAAARHNDALLQANNYDLAEALEWNHKSPLAFGSEFRAVEDLAKVVGSHPLWPRLKEILSNGSNWPAEERSLEDRQKDLQEALEFGNHKGALKQEQRLFDLLREDVIHGYALPILREHAARIPGLLLSPMNIAEQDSISARGEIVAKLRLTHDHSFDFGENSAINSRARLEDLEPAHFGKALRRFIYFVVDLRRRFPEKRIFLVKGDWKAAYRRIHLHPDTAIQCATQFQSMVLVPLRLTFGGGPCSSEFSNASELGCDLANVIVEHPQWDPNDPQLQSPHFHKIPPPSQVTRDPKDRPRPARRTFHQVPQGEENILAKFDNFIDDLIGAGVEVDDTIKRLAAVGPLVFHALGRPLSEQEQIPRTDPLSLAKFEAEGMPEEKKTILGWDIDTHALTMSLPKKKFLAWSSIITTILQAEKVTFKALESLIGRLQHATDACPLGKHFLGRLRAKLWALSHRRRALSPISNEEKRDLQLWLHFLKQAATGISLNLLVEQIPARMYRTDACIHGLGGYNDMGRAWRYEIPAKLRRRAHINLLEFIAQLVGVWVDLLGGHLTRDTSVLSQGDNTSAIGWISKTNFEGPDEHVYLKVARKYAHIMMEAGISHVGDWLPGVDNPIADSLSRDVHLSLPEHRRLLTQLFPQLPPHFVILQLPSAISSWIDSLLQSLPASREPCRPPTPSGLSLGNGGLFSLPRSDANLIPSSNTSIRTLESSSSAPFSSPFETGLFNDEAKSKWLQARSTTPSHNWSRPLWQTASPTQPSTQAASEHSFYAGNWQPSPRPTRPRNGKRPFASASSSECNETLPPPSSMPKPT
jgi:hypothetical protein